MEYTKRSVLLALLMFSFNICCAENVTQTNATDHSVDQIQLDELHDDLFADIEDDLGLDEIQEVYDPLEPMNRAIFWFNDKIYFLVMRPVKRAYRVVPEPVRISVANFFSNLASPIRFINAGLQLKFEDAGNELIRFVVNTTVGIAGLFDPANKYMGIRQKQEDFGQTLGYYGADSGFYIVLPVLGPSNVRDTLSLPVDYLLDPVLYIVDDDFDRIGVYSVDIINDLSIDKDTYETIKRESLDPYTTFKNAYEQSRKGKIEK
ncbi:MAG: VacJ family lipoprotein [Gammaproteobacteria bacterium]